MENNELIDLAKNRRAVKEFDRQHHISDADFAALLEVTRFSPTSHGLEPWRIVVLQNMSIREQLKQYASGAQLQLDTCSHFVIFTVVTTLNAESEYFKHINFDIKGGDEKSYSEFLSKYKAFQQRQDLTDSRKQIDWAGKQAYIAMSNMMFAASMKSIASCPIEGFSSVDANEFLYNKGILDRNKERIAVMLALGYQNGPIHKKNRRPISEIVRYIR